MTERVPLRVTGLVRDNGHPSDFWRLIEPFSLARELGHDCYCAIRGRQIVHPPDVIILRGEIFKRDYFERFIRQCELDRVLVVTDYDDLYNWDVQVERPKVVGKRKPMGEAGQQQIRAALQLSHLVTTTTPYLAEQIRAISGRGVVIIPNAIKLENWSTLRAPGPGADPVLAIIGSESHWQDWKIAPPVFRELATRVPRLQFRVVGCDPPWHGLMKRELGDRIQFWPWAPFDRYPTLFEGATIVWQPLRDDPFNASRTPIRHWEASAAGAAFIGARLVYDQSVADGYDGYLADDQATVVDRVAALCDDDHARLRVVSNARQTARAHALTPECVEQRMNVYYAMWQEVYGGTSSITTLRATGDEQPGCADPSVRFRAVLPRDQAPDGRDTLRERSYAGDGRDGAPVPVQLWTPRGEVTVGANR